MVITETGGKILLITSHSDALRACDMQAIIMVNERADKKCKNGAQQSADEGREEVFISWHVICSITGAHT
jgi:hypothetical protein